MNFLKKLFSKKQKNEEIPEKKNECWYNNAHESVESSLGIPMEGAALSSDNSFENAGSQNDRSILKIRHLCKQCRGAFNICSLTRNS